MFSIYFILMDSNLQLDGSHIFYGLYLSRYFETIFFIRVVQSRPGGPKSRWFTAMNFHKK